MNKILALDQRSQVTGWAIFEDGELTKYGKINATQSDIGDRLYYIREEVSKLIKDNEIEEIFFEDIQLQTNVTSNVHSFKVLAEVFGVLEELFSEMRLPHTAVVASTWKSTLGIKGRNRAEQKRNARQYVVDAYGLKVTQDEADAICIGSHAVIKADYESTNDWSD